MISSRHTLCTCKVYVYKIVNNMKKHCFIEKIYDDNNYNYCIWQDLKIVTVKSALCRYLCMI